MSKFMYFNFRCLTCNTAFEDFVKPDVLPLCPECSDANTVKVCSAATLSNKMESRENHWVKQNKQKTAQDKKFYAEHGADKKHHSYGS